MYGIHRLGLAKKDILMLYPTSMTCFLFSSLLFYEIRYVSYR